MRSGPLAAAVIGVLAGCVAAACGAGPAKVTPHHSGSPSRSVGAGGRASGAAAARCGGLVRVGPGATVPGWRLGAIDFVSPRLGVALTAAQVPCGSGPGQGIGFPAQQVRLAVSSDGGREWVTRGRVLADGGPDPGFEQIAAASARRVWALTDDGRLLQTGNGGRSWTLSNTQPTAQFYRVALDNDFPYNVYGAQQDNSTVRIASRTTGGFRPRWWTSPRPGARCGRWRARAGPRRGAGRWPNGSPRRGLGGSGCRFPGCGRVFTRCWMRCPPARRCF